MNDPILQIVSIGKHPNNLLGSFENEWEIPRDL